MKGLLAASHHLRALAGAQLKIKPTFKASGHRHERDVVRQMRRPFMTFTARVSFVLLWLASLVLVGVFASAQTRREPGAIISGADIGFRPDGWNGKRRTGTWLVRIDGHSLMRNR